MASRKKPPGRPSKLTEQVRNTIVLALSSGCYRQTAAEHAGIGVSTFYRWMEQGEADAEHDKDSPQRELWDAVKKAEADAEVGAAALIRAQAPKNWQAAAWLLERKHPERWGRRERVEHTGPGGGPVETISIPDTDVYRRKVAELAARVIGTDGDGR